MRVPRCGFWVALVLLTGCGSDEVDVAGRSDAGTSGHGGAAAGSGGNEEAGAGGAAASGGSAGAGGSAGSAGSAAGGSAAGGADGDAGPAGDAGTGGTLDCDADDGTGWEGAWQALECELINLLNARRQQGATCGTDAIGPRSTLARSAALTTNAREHSADMAEHGYAGVVNSAGEQPWDWAPRGHSGGWRSVAVAVVDDDPADVLETLLGEAGTCANVMAQGATVGVGYYENPFTMPDGGAEAGALPVNFVHYWTVIVGG